MIATAPTEVSTFKAEYNFGCIWLVSIAAALGGLLFGWDWAGRKFFAIGSGALR